MKYYVYEREPRMNSKPDSIILGPYSSANEAENKRVDYGFTDDNYYVKEEPFSVNTGRDLNSR